MRVKFADGEYLFWTGWSGKDDARYTWRMKVLNPSATTERRLLALDIRQLSCLDYYHTTHFNPTNMHHDPDSDVKHWISVHAWDMLLDGPCMQDRLVPNRYSRFDTSDRVLNETGSARDQQVRWIHRQLHNMQLLRPQERKKFWRSKKQDYYAKLSVW